MAGVVASQAHVIVDTLRAGLCQGAPTAGDLAVVATDLNGVLEDAV